MLATASVAADTAPLADDLSDFEILDGWPSSCMLCVCARVCVSICMYFVYQDIYRGFGVCVCVSLSLCIKICICKSMCACMYVCVYVYVYVCVYVYVFLCVYEQVMMMTMRTKTKRKMRMTLTPSTLDTTAARVDIIPATERRRSSTGG